MSTIDQQTQLRSAEALVIRERSIHSAYNVFTKQSELTIEEKYMMKEIYNGKRSYQSYSDTDIVITALLVC